jgi:carbamoyltransferase
VAVILGINAMHAGAAAALLVDGVPVMALPEERLNRVKYYGRFPALAIERCLGEAGLRWQDVDAVAIGRDRSANRAQKLRYVASHPTRLLNLMKIRSARSSIDTLEELIRRECGVDPKSLRFTQHSVEHHLAHTASAYFASNWESASGITIDGSGDFVSCMMSRCEGTEIHPLHRIFVPQSLGSFYTMICSFIGYDRYGDEGKVMGLAPLGKDTYREMFEEIIHLTPDGFRLNPDFFMPFGSNQGVIINEKGEMEVERHFSDRVTRALGEPRQRHAEITERDADLAFGLQQRFESVYLHLLKRLHERAPHERLAMAGGCALNSVANGRIFAETPFGETSIQPAAGDDGLALGAAQYVSHAVLGEPRSWVMRDAYLGTEYPESALRRALDERDVSYERVERAPLLRETARALASGNVVGWFQGRMEWGPRALGNRSILAHPGLPDMKDVLNARIKHREPFRPFAPAVLDTRQAEIFERSEPSPFMLHVYEIREAWRDRLCAVNHVDDTGRLQTVSLESNALFYELILAFEAETGLPVLLNTSFNENEPIVEHPSQAVDCFLRTGIDLLVLGPFLCRREGREAARS